MNWYTFQIDYFNGFSDRTVEIALAALSHYIITPSKHLTTGYKHYSLYNCLKRGKHGRMLTSQSKVNAKQCESPTDMSIMIYGSNSSM